MFTEEQIKKHDDCYEEGWHLIKDIILTEGQRRRRIRKKDRMRLRRAISLFELTIQINEQNWNSMWVLGKIHQRLGEYEHALRWFSRAHKIEPTNPDISREAGLCAMDLGKAQEAITFTQSAIENNPEDAGLVANLALALLIAGELGEASKKAREAINRNPKDRISKNVLTIIDRVINGKIKPPKTLLEISKY